MKRSAASSPAPPAPLSCRILASIVIGIGVVARLLAARGAYLMPDEQWHMRIAGGGNLAAVYRASLGSAHPPVFMMLLHFWSEVARSEWQLRLLPVAFAAASLFVVYRWVRLLFGETASLIALTLFSLLPSLVLLSSELRAYGLLLLFLTASLASLERALARRSVVALCLSALWSALALLTHYAALWVILGAGLYAGVRIARERLPMGFDVAWVALQAALALLCLGLYVTHVSKLRGGALEHDAQSRWLETSYFHAGSGGVLRFAGRQTLSVFTYLLSGPVAGAVALALFVFALAWLARERDAAALLLLVPFLASLAAGLLALYPYGGTRHSVDLALVACAGIGMALAKLSRGRPAAAIALAIVLAPAALSAAW